MSYKPWAADEIAYLQSLATSQKMGRNAIAQRLGRTEHSVSAKLAELRGVREKRLDVGSGIRFTLGYERPTPRLNDDFKHLTLIARANNGMGYPSLNIRPTYRVAA